MDTQYRDDQRVEYRIAIPLLQGANQSYYVEVPALALDEQSRLIEQVILFALDTLGARHLDMRVQRSRAIAHDQPLSTTSA